MFRASARYSKNTVRRVSGTLAALFVSAVIARAEWTIASSDAEFSSGRLVEHRHVVARSETGDEAAVDLALFSPKTATLRVIDRAEANDELAAVMQREHCIAGVNGGYFDPNYAPVGLLISDGRLVAPQQKARLLSGVVIVANGRIQVQRAAEFSPKTKPTAPRQCGPFLVDSGKPIAGLNDTRSARRTFVALAADGRALLGLSSYVTLAQLGSLLATPELTGTSKVQRAMNMDGGSSSGFWFAGERDVFAISEQKTVRDYLGVVPK